MICSVELPIKYLSEYSKYFDYDFVIASTWADYPEYSKYFIKQRPKKRFTILDNGAFEKGEAIDNDKYIEIVEKLYPNVVILPDCYKNSVKTLKRSEDFLSVWKKSQLRNDIELMGVVQGRSWIEIESLAEIYRKNGISWIGIPYATGLDRYQLIKAHPEWEKVHILGLPVVTEVLALNTLPNVVSVDSSLPVKCTGENKELLYDYTAKTYFGPTEQNLCKCPSVKSKFLFNLKTFSKICHEEIGLSFLKKEKESL